MRLHQSPAPDQQDAQADEHHQRAWLGDDVDGDVVEQQEQIQQLEQEYLSLVDKFPSSPEAF